MRSPIKLLNKGTAYTSAFSISPPKLFQGDIDDI